MEKAKSKVNYAGMGNQRQAQKSDKSGKAAYDQTMKMMANAGNAAAIKAKAK